MAYSAAEALGGRSHGPSLMVEELGGDEAPPTQEGHWVSSTVFSTMRTTTAGVFELDTVSTRRNLQTGESELELKTVAHLVGGHTRETILRFTQEAVVGKLKE